MMNYQNKHGFTIMEVLLALVISCVVMVASVPILTVQKNYGHIEKWNRNQSGADVFYGSPKDNLKVGIGTTTPRARLHVRGYEDRPTTPVMTIRAANNTGDHSVNFVFADSNLNEVGRLAATTRDGTSIAIGAGAANNMGIDGKNPTNSVAIGVNAMRNMENSADNVIIGENTYKDAVKTDGNVIIGGNIAEGAAFNYPSTVARNYIIADHRIGDIKASSMRNILIGDEAGANNNLGSENICIGNSTCTNGSHSSNIVIGNYASYGGSSGSGRIVIGSYGSETQTGSYVSGINNLIQYPDAPRPSEETRKLVWGAMDGTSLRQTAKGRIVGGVIDVNGNTTTIRYADVEANNVYTNTSSLKEYELSDKRYKNIVGEYKKSLDDLEKISVYRYKYKSDGPDGLESSGVIAQEIKSVFPDAVTTRGKKDIYMVNYDYINMATLNAVKDLQKRNKELKQRVEKLKKIVSESKTCACQ